MHPTGPKDQQRKLTPYLLPFADLPPDIADYDRIFVRNIPAFLAAAGLQVIRGTPALTHPTRLLSERRTHTFAADSAADHCVLPWANRTKGPAR
ncbi:MAG: hypothetical protein ACM4D3_21475 [Candidatus Sericytochromatia bacterium]